MTGQVNVDDLQTLHRSPKLTCNLEPIACVEERASKQQLRPPILIVRPIVVQSCIHRATGNRANF